MKLQCSRCHTVFEAQGEHPRCPTCGAASGLERVHPPGLPMRMFAGVLGLAATVAIVGAVVTRISG